MLLCDFHIHSIWSDGRCSIPEIVDLFGRARHDVIAITDHVVNQDSLLGKTAHRLRLSVKRETLVDCERSPKAVLAALKRGTGLGLTRLAGPHNQPAMGHPTADSQLPVRLGPLPTLQEGLPC